MYKLLHFISEEGILSEYENHEDLEASYKDHVDGLEVILCGFDHSKYIREEKIVGLHLPFFSDWMSYWLGNKKILQREFGSQDIWEEFYGNSDPLSLIGFFQKDMDYAQEVGAKYVVFHLSNVSMEETITRKYDYTDEEVIEASIDLINRLFEGKNYDFEFLLENLAWPGLQFKDPELAKKLLEEINYDKLGFVLDTGHMMQTNFDIQSPEEGIDYIYQWFENNIDLIPYVRAIHLHQSISGHIAKEMLKNPINLEEDFYTKFSQVYEFVFQLDQHQVCDADNALSLIHFLQPEYLVYEFRAKDRQDRERKLERQSEVLKSQEKN